MLWNVVELYFDIRKYTVSATTLLHCGKAARH